MPQPDRVPQELIEANVEIAFSLVDLAEEHLNEGDTRSATRILQDVEDVLADIRHRLAVMGSEKGWPFDPLLAELNRALERARSHAG